MKRFKYQICEKVVYLGKTPKFNENNFHAGGKAPSDVATIAKDNGYKELYIRKLESSSPLSAVIRKFLLIDWINLYLNIKKNSILLVQTPIRWGNHKIREFFFLALRKNKNVIIVSLIHDIEPLRAKLYKTKESFDRAKQEFELTLRTSDFLITHNYKMKEYLVSCGFNASKIIELKIFDYLTSEIESEKFFENTVIYAGNLASKKSPFLAEIGSLGIKFDLYGINYVEKDYNSPDVNYKGSFLSADLPAHLNNGFGLVWDGDSSATCSGMGEYLRWNNPHKLSLYLVSGLPVFIWKQAAEAKFVEENKVGVLISSLPDIRKIFRNITKEQYSELVKNAVLVSKKLRKGFFTSEALKAVEESL